MSILLTRDMFREGVFARDMHKCVFCDKPAKDAHHILERRLFADGGYYLSNGASVCEEHHLACERTDISVEEVREAAGITEKVIPLHFYPDMIYDKWGNVILENGKRLKGDLFYDESVQKIIANHLDKFINYVKYPRTLHVPWSPGATSDDRLHKDMSYFEGKEVVVTEKLDGENFSGYSDYCHARSIDGDSHVSREWAKNFWYQRGYNLPDGWRICAENLYAVHSIRYDNLESWLIGFSVWNEKNVCLSWKETVEWFELLEMKHVPVLYTGIYDEKAIKELYDEKKDYDSREGYVVRLAEEFSYRDFSKAVAKYVRKGHVATSRHWKKKSLEINGIIK